MIKRKLKGLLIHEEEKATEIVEFVDELDNFYKLIKCDTIHIIEREIKGRLFAIVVNDNGLLEEGHQITGIWPKVINQEAEIIEELVGNIIVLAIDEADTSELRGLTDKEIDFIKQALCPLPFTNREVLIYGKN